ncbi:(deoxy)nucleoside triphosphate pyrophosphohydrolase [Nocardioides lijunqiniae]|uniref:(deoxy)nucleoside triphosphate pyrophosphohydrolase n=1 Tax=Nocardioides lijunqiniae TaxID=2760832 RepID=UPI0030B836FE
MKQVVGAALVRHARVLAARRTSPPEAAGRWELPGGKVEDGELPGDALVREVAEELGCTVEVTDWLAGRVPIGPTHELTVALVRLVAGEPEPTEHDEVRWLTRDELADVDWLEPDRPFLSELAARLGSPEPLLRAILFEEEHARAMADRLTRDGFEASVVRERLQGEDDDEDHPWAVLSDAPAFVVEVLVDEYDGWLDRDSPDPPAGPAGPAPVELPTQPKRRFRDGS